MTRACIIGPVVLAIGVILLAFARRASNAPMDQVASALTVRFTRATMW